MTPDEELKYVNSAKNGDEGAFEALVRECQTLVYNLALKITRNPDDALDISQDTFLKAYSNLSSFRGDSRFSGWVYRLCYNASMDFIRRNRHPNVISMTSQDDTEAEYEVPDPSPQPDEKAEKSDLQERVRNAVMSLPDDKREIIIMREFSDMSYTDIAKALNIEEGTVKSRLSRARASLAEILRKDGTFSAYVSSNREKGGKRSE